MSEDGNSKLEELRRRFEHDPGSRVFLQLAEEYRKAGQFDEAIAVCLSGLEKHPDYATARVTLARCYEVTGRKSEARVEFERVVAAVPDNLLANRSLGDLYYEAGRGADALGRYRVVQMLGPADEQLSARISALETGSPPIVETTATPVVSGVKQATVDSASNGAGFGDEMAGFMDLKIDESVILNSDIVAAALGNAADSSKSGSEEGAADDFGDFSAPTMVMKASDVAHIPGVAERTQATPPPPPAESVSISEAQRAQGLPSFAARSAEKFGISRYSDAPAPGAAKDASPPGEAPAPVAEAAMSASESASLPDEPSADDGFGAADADMGMDEFSEFAAPTVMLNVADLAASGVLSEDSGSSKASTPSEGAGALSDGLPDISNPFDADSTESDSIDSPIEPPARSTFESAPADDLGTRAISIEDIEAARRAAEVVVADDDPFSDVSSSSAAAAVSSPAISDSAVKAEAVKAEAVKAEAVKAEAVKAEAVKAEAVKVEPPVVESSPEQTPSEPEAPTGKILAELYLRQGHVSEALKTYESYASLHPQDQEVSGKIAELRARLAPAPAVTPAAPAPAGGGANRQAKIAKLSSWLSSLKKS